MKKLCNLILTLLLAASVLLLSFGCGGASLGTPGNLVVNDDLMLSWAAVQSARSYRLEIVNVESGERQENVVQRTSYDLAKLPEGDYELRLRAVGGSENDVYSAWSEVYPFHRDKESGLLFTSVEGNTAYEVRSVGSASGDVEIERIYRDKPVVGIGQTAFRGSSKLTRITIPDTVTYIGASAFYNCSGLLSVEIPASVVSIGRAAFQQCSSLSSISLPAAITRIESFTFAYCRALPEISLSEQIVFIGESAFSNCSAVTELTVPDSVQTIGPNAFRQMTGLTRVSLGSGLRSFGDSAFYGCTALKDVEFSPLEGEMVLSEAAFADCSALQSVSLPKGVTRIETNCFTNDVALESVVIPSGVSEIEPNAFYHSKLYDEQMASGDGLVYAGNWVIDATEDYKKTVTDLNETTFREGTVGIADFAFRYTWQVEVEVEVEDENGEIVTETRTRVETVSCEKLRRISFPSSMKYIGQGAFYHAPVLQRVLATYEDSLERVGSYAFAYCPMLNNVRFATGLKEIETRAFFQCELLDYSDNNPELLIPTSVTRVGENAFYGTALWYRDDITDGVVYAGNWVVGYHLDPAFEGEEPQSLIELREGTVGICDYGFYGVQTLQNITGLNRVERIGTGLCLLHPPRHHQPQPQSARHRALHLL